MKRSAWSLLLVIAPLACATPKPPTQTPEPLPTVAEAASGAPTAAAADIGASLDPGVPEAPSEPFPPVAGALGGKPWELKGAGTVGPIQKDGTVLIAFANYAVDCTAHTAGPDDRTIAIKVPWKAKTKVDLGKLKPGDVTAVMIDEKKNKPVSVKAWRPKGTLEVVSAPTAQKTSGRIKIELTSGTDAITAEIPVKFCFPE